MKINLAATAGEVGHHIVRSAVRCFPRRETLLHTMFKSGRGRQHCVNEDEGQIWLYLPPLQSYY